MYATAHTYIRIYVLDSVWILLYVYTDCPDRCGDGMGMALWILEVYVVLLDATDLHHVKGCTLTPPYLDQYGESDPGLRSVGNSKIHSLFLHKFCMFLYL